MAKRKERITPIVSDETTPNIVQPNAPLPSLDEVTQTITAVTKAAKLGRPIKKEAQGREKITTRLDQYLIMDLKMKAIQRRVSLADLISLILSDNIDKY